MAVAEKIYAQSYGYLQEEQHGYSSYERAYSEHSYQEAPERQKIKRTRNRPQPQQGEVAVQGFSGQELRQLLAAVVCIGILLIGILVLNAYAASIQVTINALTKENATLENEIDTLNMKIDSNTSIAQIETYAMEELNMAYPKSDQCIYIEDGAKLRADFAQTLKEKAYDE